MSYEFTSDEPVGAGVRRIVRDEIGLSSKKLMVKTTQARDEAIHEVRKSVKRVRGLLKLLRPALGETYYLEEERAWRDLGRRLAALRDAGAMVEVIDDLRNSCPREVYQPVRRCLVAVKRQTEQAEDVARVLARVKTGLRCAETRLQACPLESDGFEAISPGFRQTYRQGIRALRSACERPSAENLHQLRKRAKEHLYQVRLLAGLWDAKLRQHENRVRRLEEMLGARQNLAVLKKTILGQSPGIGQEREVEVFLTVLDRMERKLTQKSLKEAEKVYGKPAWKLTGHVERLWTEWRNL
jgi:CHAD domain-containing protein